MPLFITPLTLPATGPLWIDLSGITPDRLADLSLSQIERLPLLADGRASEFGLLFSANRSTDGSDGAIECVGDFSRVHRIGAKMTIGTIVVQGDAGRHAGEAMTGGTLTITGDAGDWLAAEMTGGTLRVGGRAGDNVAGALPGSRAGMQGGVVVIAGDVGCLAGARMRRGMLAIGGDCGAGVAFEMRAGTALVAGRIGENPCLGMKRGTLIALASIPALSPTFQRGSVWSPTFMPLLANRLARAHFQPAKSAGDLCQGKWQQWHGDTLYGGRGEVFHR